MREARMIGMTGRAGLERALPRLCVALSTCLAAAASAPGAAAQTLSGTSDAVLLVPNDRTEAGPIRIFVDGDVDGMPDAFEAAHGLDPADPLDALADLDSDGLRNLVEFKNGTDPRNADTDGDGVGDGSEVLSGSDPLDPAEGGANVALLSLGVVPSSARLALNSVQVLGRATLQLRVEGALSDGRVADLTASSRGTTYASSDPAVAVVDSEGLVSARGAGSAMVTAANGSASAEAGVTVIAFSPRALGFVPIPGFANNVDVRGSFAFVAAGSAGLVVADASDPSAPRVAAVLDTPGNADDVRVVGNLAVVADGASGLQVIDIADPARPRTVAAVDTPGEASDVAVRGNLAYVADGTAGLQVIDLADPPAARIVGSVDTPGIAFGVDVQELRGIAVVAGGFAVQVVDVSDPAHPILRGSVPIPGTSGFGAPAAVDVAVSGSVAFVAAGLSGLQVVDIRDPSAPRVIGATGVAMDAQDVEVAGGVAVVAEDLFVNAVPVFDLGSLAAPAFAGAIDLSGFPCFRDDNGTGLALSGNLLFLTGDRTRITQNGVSGDSALHIGVLTEFNDGGVNAPFVRITSPGDGGSVGEGRPFTVEIEASDDVAVASVEVLLDGTGVATLLAPPYRTSLTVPGGIGQVTLGARATDFAGNVGEAGPVELAVVADTPPSVRITSPAAGARLLEGQALLVSAEASDDAAVSHVAFTVNAASRTDGAAPYEAAFAVPAGVRALTIEATATDGAGQSSSALRVAAVAPDPPPSVVITSPGAGASVVAGSSVRVVADASDNVRVDAVRFTVDGASQPADTTPPYSLTLSVPVGPPALSLEAEATDNLGQAAFAAPRTVGVVADPGTTVIGRVVDGSAQPVAGALVSVFGQFTGTADGSGAFAVTGVPASRGEIVAVASATVGGVPSEGRSDPVPPIPAHETYVGSIVLTPAAPSNAFYRVLVEGSRGGPGVGVYNVRTGPAHPITLRSGSQSLLAGAAPGTSFTAIRSYTSGADYVQRSGLSLAPGAPPTYTLEPFVQAGEEAVPFGDPNDPVGFTTTYRVSRSAGAADDLKLEQVARVVGTAFDDSAFRLTTTITNEGAAEVRVGIRYLWDLEVGANDCGPTFQARSPDGAVLTEEADHLDPPFETIESRDNNDPAACFSGGNSPFPFFEVRGSVVGPAPLGPTPPTRLTYASWPAVSGLPDRFGGLTPAPSAFTYTPAGADIATCDVSLDDSAAVYWWGDEEANALVIAPGQSVSVSAYLYAFTGAPPGF